MTVVRTDIAACVRADGHVRCYPGGERHISGAACPDSFACELRVEVPVLGGSYPRVLADVGEALVLASPILSGSIKGEVIDFR